MPQMSRPYAVARVRAQARRPLSNAQLERLVAAPGYAEARATLTEMGWAVTPEDDVVRLSVRMTEEACARLRALTPQPGLTDAFLLRHDAQNLKALVKARMLGQAPEGLSRCGTMDVEALRHAVADRVYRILPEPLKAAMNELEKRLAASDDARLVDVVIDRGLFLLAKQMVAQSGSAAAVRYFTELADLQNAISWLRLRAMGRPHAEFMDTLLPGGSVTDAQWKALEGRPERLAALLPGLGGAVRTALLAAAADARAIPALEKAMDDRLLTHFRPYRFSPEAPEVLIGDLLAREREAAAVRLVLTGKLNAFPQETIRERLREAYGG